MFLLDGKPLSPDVAFVTADGTQYPANWLRLASPEERAAIGITEAPEPESYDQRFYWGPGNPKDLAGLKDSWTTQVKSSAGSLLSSTDWKITRAAEGVKPVDPETLADRAAIRAYSNTLEASITACTTVEELIAIVTTQEWPRSDIERNVAVMEPEVPQGEL
jgi:hypothetical protein